MRTSAMRNGAVIPWVTVETLTPDTMTVASVGNAPREFAGVQRVLQRLLAKTPAFYDSLNTAGIGEALQSCLTGATDVDLRVPTGAGPHLLRLRPVFGPTGAVHAIRMWLGPAGIRIPEPGMVVGAIWDLPTQTIQLPSGITRMPGIAVEEYVPRMSIAEFFYRTVGFDRHAEVLDLLYDHKPGDKMQFEVNLLAGTGRPGRWRISMRGRDDERAQGAWWLIEDVTSPTTPLEWPTLERVGLREAHRRAGNHLAVIQLEHTSISHWLTDPAPWIRWDYLFRPVDVFHPEDRGRLIELGTRLRAGDTAGITVRTLNYAGDYTPSSLLLYPYPGYSSRPLTIAEVVRAADTPAVALPQRPVPDPDRTPIGYDEQLWHWLAGRMKRSPAY